jgi:hypothetical protein
LVLIISVQNTGLDTGLPGFSKQRIFQKSQQVWDQFEKISIENTHLAISIKFQQPSSQVLLMFLLLNPTNMRCRAVVAYFKVAWSLILTPYHEHFP